MLVFIIQMLIDHFHFEAFEKLGHANIEHEGLVSVSIIDKPRNVELES